jgi:hypothetical protein
MIGRVLPRGGNLRGLLHYLYGPGKKARHTNPHLVAGWVHPAEIEPPRRKDGKRSFSRLTELMELPVRVARGKGRKVPGKYVYHLTVRCTPVTPTSAAARGTTSRPRSWTGSACRCAAARTRACAG